MWKLQYDNKDYDCQLEERPTINIPEEQQEDGTWKLVGEGKWLPLKIETNCPQWTGPKNVVLSLSNSESWTLTNAEWEGSSLVFNECRYEVK